MCRKREIYTTSPDTYCSVIKQYFNEKGIDYREVDIGKNEARFYELIRLYGKGPLPIIVEDGRIVPITQVMQNAHVMFQGYAGNIE